MRRTVVAISFLVVLTFAFTLGCGGKPAAVADKPAEPAGAKETSEDPEKLLVGDWEGEVEVDEHVVAAKLAAVKNQDEKTQNRVRWAIETPTSVKSKLGLKPGGKMTMEATFNTAEGEKTLDGEGTWEVLSAEGYQATVRLTTGTQVEEKVFVFEDLDAFATDPPGADKTIGTLKFKRLR